MKVLIALCLSAIIVFAECQLKCHNENEMCGGIAGFECCTGQGLRCYAKPEDKKDTADWSGVCIKGCQREGEMCGGIAANIFRCCQGTTCHIPDNMKNVADASGQCVPV